MSRGVWQVPVKVAPKVPRRSCPAGSGRFPRRLPRRFSPSSCPAVSGSLAASPEGSSEFMSCGVWQVPQVSSGFLEVFPRVHVPPAEPGRFPQLAAKVPSSSCPAESSRFPQPPEGASEFMSCGVSSIFLASSEGSPSSCLAESLAGCPKFLRRFP